jgi:hypothetical protein
MIVSASRIRFAADARDGTPQWAAIRRRKNTIDVLEPADV